MDLIANDLSVHEQFHDIASFRDALGRLMAMRLAARRFRHGVHCHRTLLTASPMPGVSMQQAIGRLANRDEQRAAMGWLTQAGPFWDDLRQHGADDWLECLGDIVTDTAIGEAAFRTLHGVKCGLVSVTPSDWNYSPVEVALREEGEEWDPQIVTIDNWRDATALEEGLGDAAPPIDSWNDLREASESRFASLIFAGDCFDPLEGVPFVKSSAERFLVLLGILDRFARAFDEAGARTPEGHKIYRDHFTGDRALFSDSSDTEKREFHEELTFVHPNDLGSSLFCTWHGKVSHLTLRLHLSWPVEADEPVYVVYAGPKITRR